ncbi:MAG TPA: acetoacetate--CoA ligase, partial [Acidimicrobiales bacterium]|nr:acetoacetate--CoA ligase [Acidimicrobiales bacterium]
GRVAAGLAEAGVGAGDTVAGYLPNGPEAVVGLLAAATLGARWTCCAPEMGAAGVLDRLGQVSPAVLVAADGYVWNGRAIDRGDEAAAIADGLPSLRQRVWVTHRDTAAPAPPGWRPWADLGAGAAAPDPCEVAADHPLHVLYSSGTTGRPKAIVHGHAGIALEHAKALALHFDLGPGDRFCWYTTTGWMMWNFLVSGLLVGATVVCYDGAPGDLWRLFAETGTTVGGMGAAALAASEKAGRRPADEVDLSTLRTLGSTGSPLAASTAAWVYDAVKADVALGSFSGGTDVCTGFVGPSPLHPVWAGEISCACLGAAVGVVDDAGRPVVGVEGELVLTAPLPSMPLEFVADPGGHRLHDAYYATFPRLWDHGDRATLTERGTLAITGRSDGTLNRGGVRMGTAELYGVVEALDGVADSLAVHLEATDELWLFVVAADDAGLDERIRAALRSRLSPRHVPDRIVRVPAVPRTLSGKKLEVPVKRLLAGADLADVVALAAVANPAAFDAIVAARPG